MADSVLGEVSVDTAFGGVFYLVNLGLFLDLYGDFTQPMRPGLSLPIWDFVALLDESRKVRKVEKEADAIYRSAISGLFVAEQIDFRDLLKQKEALDDLERAVDHCDNVADLLSNLAVKHG